MNEWSTDFELLRDFVKHGEQPAFAAVVRRHLDLVYATALRKAEDEGAAQEIAQNVFATLARKAWQFAPDDSLPAWLYKTTLLEAREWLRGELRRRRREQTAAELGTTMKTPEEQSAFRALVPLLDEALLSLREKDRTALLLRFYERQSLREVGASLGVGEDAAQKRVGSALEKLAEFFQRRGFRTATVAATAAVLQHTAASASAATSTLVLNGALQSAPGAVAGLTGLLARLASLSQAQVAALCVVVASLPVGWQWHEQRVAKQEATRVQSELESLRLEQTSLETEIRQLTGTADRLDASLAKSAEIEAANAESARMLEAWKTRIRRELTAVDYHWPDDSPFVRIPKSAVRSMDVHMPIEPPGTIKSEARELLGLSPGERTTMEEGLRNYFADVDRLIDAGIHETNRSARLYVPASAVASEILYVPPLGDEAKASSERITAEMKAVLGDQRWPLVESQMQSYGTHTLRRVLNLDADHDSQEVAVWVNTNDQGVPTVGYQWASLGSSFSTDGATLASLLPGGDPTGGRSALDGLRQNNLPDAVTTRMLSWWQAQAAARLGKEPQP
jgi:RNA polymerase sigma factor (sigma-70 family)